MKKITLFIIISLCFKLAVAQNQLKQVTALTPDAAALFKYNEIPVSLYTGLPNVSIPLFEFKEGELSLPISLSYHAGSNKVYDQPGWLGLGWSLSVGGVITRTVKGLPDEITQTGYFYNKTPYDLIPDWNNFFLEGGSFSRNSDGAPDVFSFSFNGNSGHFVFDANNNSLVFPASDIKVELIQDPVNGGTTNEPTPLLKVSAYPNLFDELHTFQTYFQGFKITTTDGTVYEFRKIELSYPHGYVESDRAGFCRVDTWYLSKIVAANGSDVINYVYSTPTDEKRKYHTFAEKDNSYKIVNAYDGIYNTHNIFSCGLNDYTYLESIEGNHSGTKIVFNKSNKNDLPYLTAYISEFKLPAQYDYRGLKLDNIEISNKGTLKKKFKCAYLEEESSKLKLTSVTETGSDGQSTLNPYLFTYSKIKATYTSPRDHLGYYTPGAPVVGTLSAQQIGDRNPDLDPQSLTEFPDLLTKITYPTLGYTQFEYESNTFGKVISDPAYVFKQLQTRRITRAGSDYYAIKDGTKAETETITVNEQTPVFASFTFTSPETSTTSYYCAPVSFCSKCNCAFTLWLDPGTYTFNDIITKFLKDGMCEEDKYNQPTGRHWYDATIDGKLCTATLAINYYKTSTFEYMSGARIKTLTSYDNVTGNAITKTYSYVKEDGISPSGIISSFPDHESSIKVNNRRNYFDGIYTFNDLLTPTMKFGSFRPLFPMALTDGSPVAYSRVIESRNDGSKSIYFYSTINEYPDEYPESNSNLSFLTYKDRSDRRGKIIKIENYKAGSVNAISTITNNYACYTYLNNNYQPIMTQGYDIDIIGSMEQRGKSPIYLDCQYSTINLFYQDFPFQYVKEGFHLISSTETVDGVTKTTNYLYHPTYQSLIQTITTNTSNATINKRIAYLYPPDNATINPYKSMLAANIISVPIQTEIFEGSTKSSGEKNVFQSNTYTNSGISKTVFTTNSILKMNTAGTYEPDLLFDSYTIPGGQLLQYHKNNDINTSFIWGYNQTHPIIKAENISNSTLNTVVSSIQSDFESFITKTVQGCTTDAQKNAWKTFNTTLRNNSSLKNALITTYTYDPVYGMTSQTDPNGNTTYYEYDNFGRLIRIKDKDGNILKYNQYNYKQ